MKLWVLLLLTMASLATPAAGPRDALWRQVDDAVSKGLPRTALEILPGLIDGAVADQAWAEATKAIGRRIALETQIEGHSSGTAIPRLAQELERVPPTLKPLFHTLLANAYWGYFRQHQWQFAQRTTTASPPGDDFTAWDLRRLFAEIDRHFQAALGEDALLKTIPVSQFASLLTQGTVPDTLRPTLYDFVAHEALDFYQAGEQGLARPEDAFTVTADTPILGTLDTFLRWQPAATSTDTNSPTLKAIQLFQTLLRYHATEPDRSAWLNADIDRILFGHRVANGPDKDDRLVNAMIDVADRWTEHELSARARQAAARNLQAQGRLTEAHRLARQANEAYPNSFWTRDSRNLIAEIEAPHLSLETEYAWNPPWPAIEVHYRNLTKVWFRAIKADWSQYLDRRLPRPERLNRKQRLELLARAPALEWSADLPATRDYRQRQQSLPAPNQLAPGFYFLFASHQPGFPDASNELSVATVWVSSLALLTRNADSALEGFVVDAATGEPRPEATVEAWYLAPGGNRTPVPAQKTDDAGYFRLNQAVRDRGHLIRVTFGDQQIAHFSDAWFLARTTEPEEEPRNHSLILADRALYRPGQTIQFKGIAVRLDPGRLNYELRAGRDLTVVFRDANRQEVARKTLHTSDLGSFSGSFTAPRDRLPGQMTLTVEGEPGHPAFFNVEEYKRPKFQVVLDPPKDAPRLNGTVVVTGRALTYTGAPVDRAPVAWRVTRQVRFPFDWGFFRGPPRFQPEQEIGHGTVETAPDGSFTFRFRALADPAVLESDDPVFSFQLHVDVTDGAGETRWADRTLPIGYTALTASVSASDWQEAGRPVTLRITTRTLDDEPLAASGTLRIHRLEEPSVVHRPRLQGPQPFPMGAADPFVDPLAVDLSKPENWKLAAVVTQQGFQTSTNGVVTNRVDLPAGIYRAELETQDRFGKRVTARHTLLVLDPNADRLQVRIPHLFEVRDTELEPGQEFAAVWGTGYESGRALIEVRRQGRLVERSWTQPGRTQQGFRIPITEAHRGGFHVSVTQIRDNRLHASFQSVEVPWKNKELTLTWETFRSKLEPGQTETWTAVVKPVRPGTADSEVALRAATEMAATLYDASLDQFLPHRWPKSFDFWPDLAGRGFPFRFSNQEMDFQVFQTVERPRPEDTTVRYREFPPDLHFEGPGPQRFFRLARAPMSARGNVLEEAMMVDAAVMAAPAAAIASAEGGGDAKVKLESQGTDAQPASQTPNAPAPPLASITPRRNLTETAFFFPHLTSSSNGTFRLSFTMPEALTEWRFLGFAHDKALRSGALEARAVTAKDIMVQPNPPRFLREGDEVEFTVKVLNASDAPQAGKIQLNFSFAHDGQPADVALGNARPELPFQIPARESRAFGWRLRVPDGCGFLSFKAVAASARHSDGEEGFLPVLARRVLVTESLPLPVSKSGTKTFDFASLRKAAASPTVRHHSLQVEMASNPAWYAVLALPYLMEYPHECAEQVFNRYYANTLARHVAQSDPRIRQVFDLWRATPALESPLEKHADLKAVALAETPWVRAAHSESEQRRNLGVLFDANRLDTEMTRALHKLEEMQRPEGAWPWFDGGPRNDYISLYIVSGFGRLRQLGIDVPMDLPRRALAGVDAWMEERYERLKEQKQLDRRNLDATAALYLYARSFYLTHSPLSPAGQELCAYWLNQAREHWLSLDRQSQAHLALGFHRFGNALPADALTLAGAIARSLKERSVVSEEMGRSWREDEPGWGWSRAPIETQALMVELFQSVARDSAAADECRVWLLKQKQTQNWKSTKATADAVYAILLGGPSWLGDTALVEVALAGRTVTPLPGPGPSPRTEPGTGYYQVFLPPSEIRPELANITVTKRNPGIAWGAVHWQYFEDLANIAAFTGTPLQLTKQLFTRIRTRRGAELRPVNGPVTVGDELVVRLELRVDRDMEYLHLKDLRGSGTEPVNVLSGYRFQDGLGYYETTRDTASHFFIDYLPRGTYVFEYAVRVQHRGAYPTGVAEIQCLYAPEFNSHSQSIPLVAR